MALLTVGSQSLNMAEPLQIGGVVETGDLPNGSFTISNGADSAVFLVESPVVYDGEGGFTGGNVTGLSWSGPDLDFSIQGLNWDLGVANENFYPPGHTLKLETWFNGDDIVEGGSADDTLLGYTGNDTITGGGGNDSIAGGTGVDFLYGDAGNDTIVGGDESNLLDGGAGADVMVGGGGNDGYQVDDVNDVVVEMADGGRDGVGTTLLSYLLPDEVENLIYTGDYGGTDDNQFQGMGNSGDNALAGGEGSGRDHLDGMAGNDTLTGGDGNDTLMGAGSDDADVLAGGGDDDMYVVDANDTVIEHSGEGIDTVVTAAANYGLAANVEHLVFTTGSDVTGTGNALDNSITGSSGADYLAGQGGNDNLDGQGGGDTLDGGEGNDTFVVDSLFDTVLEAAEGGNDSVRTALNDYTLAAHVENLAYTGEYDGGAGIFVGTGNESRNAIIGGAGTDHLNGGANIDTLAGGGGDDFYTVDVMGDVVVEAEGTGLDHVNVNFSGPGTYVLSANIEFATATGAEPLSTTAVNITGNAANNILTGNAGANSLAGGAGHDILTGEAGNDTLAGDGGNDILDGGLGTDALVGGAGDDDYYAGAGDTVVEQAGGGTDRVNYMGSGQAFTLAANVENARTDSDNVTIVGNAGGNVLEGFDGTQILSGGDGNDTLRGEWGNDTLDGGAGTADLALIAGNVSNWFVSRVDAGTTLLRLKGGLELPGPTVTLRNVEQVQLGDNPVMSMTALLALAPGAGDDTVIGTDFADTLDGLAGRDSISGGGGDDSLAGGAGNDTLDGGTGEDLLRGGTGDDLYIVDDEDDHVVETGAVTLNGTDTIRTTIGSVDLTSNADLAGVDRLEYTGSGAFSGTGNALANTLKGAAGNDTLDGREGNDRLEGGAGANTYKVDSAGDLIVEASPSDPLMGDEDPDRVLFQAASASLTFSMATNAANVEEGEIVGSLAANLTGNALDNTLRGNTANNLILGGGGTDNLIVSAGTDTLDGGAGTDRIQFSGARSDWGPVTRLNATDYRISNGESTVILRNFDYKADDSIAGTDALLFDDGLVDDLVGFFEDAGNFDDTAETFEGSNDTLRGDNVDGGGGNDVLNGNDGNDTLIGGAGADQIHGGAGNDSLVGGAGTDVLQGGAGDDIYVVDAALEASESGGGGVDTVHVAYTAAGTYTLGGDFEHGLVTSTLSGVYLTGNEGNNSLTGGAGANILRGEGGNDVLDGGLGADTLVGGMGNDTFLIDNAGDVVNEGVGGGSDNALVTLATAGTWTMGAELEAAAASASSVAQVNIVGNAIHNVIGGHSGANVLSGAGGNDTLNGGGGNDTLDGGAGEDVAEVDVIMGFTVTRQSATQVTITSSLGGTKTVVQNAETVIVRDAFMPDVPSVFTMQDLIDRYGTAAADSLRGKESSDILEGLAGNDMIQGLGDSDTLVGGAGADTLDGGEGDDRLQGGIGSDTYLLEVGSGFDRVQEAGETVAGAIDTVVVGAGSGSLAGGDVRFYRGGELPETDLAVLVYNAELGNSAIIFEGFFHADGTVNASGAFEQVRFVDGGAVLTQAQVLSELLKGTADGDSIRGYGTNDLINGREGSDHLQGDAGNDTVIGGSGDDDVYGNAGADMLHGNLGQDDLFGGAGNDVLDGGQQGDWLDGGTGNDVLLGGAGDDHLDGGEGADTLIGGAGADVLDGGLGSTQGAGDGDGVSDRFVLNSLDGTDQILNFVSGVDKIAITKSVFLATTGGSNAGGTSVSALGQAWAFANGQLLYDADGAGGADALVVAQFEDGVSLGSSDILIV
jgi:Ca2+-binding RTX toxin-like protein